MITTMEAVHIRQMFKVQLPSSRFENFIPTTVEQPDNFGFNLTNFYSVHTFTFGLFCLGEDESTSRTLSTWASWAKKNALNFDNNDTILRLKVNHGVVDFRKQAEQYARIIVKHYVDGIYVKQGVTAIFQILPKKRSGSLDTDAILTINWEETNNLTNQELPSEFQNSPSNLSNDYQVQGQDNDASNAFDNPSSNNFELSPYVAESPFGAPDDTFMVLHNGNAEVIGNFRALNFYKASDINIKEDVSLLQKDRDCREALLKIDGVTYRFKKAYHSMNRRFVGYIAQQVASVVPEAVQLIDGVLHVDYESLIPFLSESIKQNFRDIKDAQSNTEQLKKVIDNMYDLFVQSEENSKKNEEKTNQYQVSAMKQTRFFGIVAIAVIAVILISMGIGLYFYTSHSIDDENQSPPSDKIDDLELRILLEEFYNDTNGRSWTNNTRWGSNAPLKDWFGLTVNENGIVRMVLSNNNLQGTIPLSFEQVRVMLQIDLSNNSLYGSIDPLLNNELLRELNISHNKFFGTLPAFERSRRSAAVLDFSHNRFYGSIPQSALLLSEYVDFSHNLLEGTLPDLSTSPSLQHLDLSYNHLAGSLSSSFPHQLQVLILEHNLFVSKASLLDGLTDLKKLNIAHNVFHGTLSIESDQLQRLELLNVSSTALATIEIDISNVNDNMVCDASDVDFACPLPSWLIDHCRARCSNKLP